MVISVMAMITILKFCRPAASGEFHFKAYIIMIMNMGSNWIQEALSSRTQKVR